MYIYKYIYNFSLFHSQYIIKFIAIENKIRSVWALLFMAPIIILGDDDNFFFIVMYSV